MRNESSGLYCSVKCRIKYRPPQPNYQVTKICEICGEQFKVKLYRTETALYCSRKCSAIGRGKKMRGENHPFWKGGVSKRPHHSRTIIRRVIKRIGKCQRCGTTENLEGHHIKHWSDSPDHRYDESNIEVLCRDCHSKNHPNLDFRILRGE